MKRFMLATIVILFVAIFSFCGGIAYERAQDAPVILAGPEGQEVFFQMQLQSMREANGGFLGTYE